MEEKNKYENKIFTIPNCISMARILASVGLFAYIGMYGITSPLWITTVAAIIGGTDAVDGFIARHFNMTSKFGKILDPIADKFFNWGIGITLMASGIMPLWPLLIGARDLMVGAISAYELKQHNRILLPTIPAKAKMLFQSIGVAATLAFGFGTTGLGLIAPIAMGAAVLTSIPEAVCIKKKYFSDPDTPKKEGPKNPSVQNNNYEDKDDDQNYSSCSVNELSHDIVNEPEKTKPKQKVKSRFKLN